MKRLTWLVLALLAMGCVAEPKAETRASEVADEFDRYSDDECLNGGCDYYEEYDEYDCYNGGCDYDDPEYQPHPASEPVTPGDLLACKAAPACERECVIDVATGASNCDLDGDASGVIIDMAEHTALTIRATLTEPDGFAFHLGDSPSNNGHGGDGAQFSRDAEVHLVGTRLLVYGSDHSLDQPGHVRDFPDFLPPGGGVLEVTLADGSMSLRMDADPTESMCFVQQSHDLLRLDADDYEGSADRLWYMGLNQVYSGGRTGSGLQRVELCFH